MSTTLIKSRKYGANINKLTQGQQMFCLEMLANKGMNATDAARLAGYKQPGVAANKLLKTKAIAAILGKLKRERIERLKMDGDRILKEIEYCALRDPLDLCDESGQIIVNNLADIPEHMRRCIDSLEITRYTDAETGDTRDVIKLKLVSKLGALEMAAKHFGLLTEKHDIQHSIDWNPLYNSNKDILDTISEEIALEEKGENA